MALLPRCDGADVDVGGVVPVFAAVLDDDGEAVFFSGVLGGEGELAPLSTLRLTEDLCGAMDGGWKTSRGEGAAVCVGESGTDVLLPTVLMGGGVAPGMRMGGGGGACFGCDRSAAASADVGLLKADLRSSKFLLEKVLVTGLATRVTLCDVVVSVDPLLSTPWLVMEVVVVVVWRCSNTEMRSEMGRLPEWLTLFSIVRRRRGATSPPHSKSNTLEGRARARASWSGRAKSNRTLTADTVFFGSR